MAEPRRYCEGVRLRRVPTIYAGALRYEFTKNRVKRIVATNNMKLQGCQKEPRNYQKHPLVEEDWKKHETWTQIQLKSKSFGRPLGGATLQTQLTTHQQINCERTWTVMPKGWHNGANIHSKTHQLSMQKIVTGKKRKSWRIMFFLIVKTCECIIRVIRFNGLQGGGANGKLTKTNTTNYTSTPPNIHDKLM